MHVKLDRCYTHTHTHTHIEREREREKSAGKLDKINGRISNK